MSDETAVATQEVAGTQEDNGSSANINTETVGYRFYGSYKMKKDEKTQEEVQVLDKQSVQGETKDKKNWETAEKDGLTILSESAVRFYSVSNEQGFIDLVPDVDQRVYLINKGLAAVQAAAVSSKVKETDDAGNFVNNGETIDLRAAINKAPERQVLNEEQKAVRTLGALSPEQKAKIFELLKAQLLAGTN